MEAFEKAEMDILLKSDNSASVTQVFSKDRGLLIKIRLMQLGLFEFLEHVDCLI